MSSTDYHLAEPPRTDNLDRLKAAAAKCTACPLYKNATQTVFGDGKPHAPLVFVGEQPGDVEDRKGLPFIGPAGKLLDRALEEVGINRNAAYVTNAVKHFKWEPQGKRRLHKTPNSRDIAACRPWLEAEFHALRPEVIVCLGKTAATSVFQRTVRVLAERGKVQPSPYCERTLITVHPSSLLRAPDEESKALQYREFLADLQIVAKLLQQTAHRIK